MKLVYVMSIGVGILSLPFYLMASVFLYHASDASRITYRARCISNGEYVVLQGSQYNEYFEFNDYELEDTTYLDTKRTLNFYCAYYDEVQPHIAAYIENSKIINFSERAREQKRVTNNFFSFRENVYSSVSAEPALYELESVKDKKPLSKAIAESLYAWVFGALIYFLALQVVRMSYVYVTTGKVAWNPFGSK